MELDKWQKELQRLSLANYKVTDAAIFKAYKETLGSIKDILQVYVDNYAELSFSKKLEAERLFKAASEIDILLNTNFKTVGKSINTFLTEEALFGYNGVFYALEGRDMLTLTQFGIDTKFINTIINQPVAGKRLSTRLYAHRDQLAKEMTNTIIRLTTQGKSYSYIARAVSNLTEASYKQALRIARTEGARVSTLATQKGYEDATKQGVNMRKRWVASLDKRTRHSHGMLDGVTIAIEDDFVSVLGGRGIGPGAMGVAGDDINCRCDTIAVVEGFEPELRQVDNEITGYITYNQWLKTQNL